MGAGNGVRHKRINFAAGVSSLVDDEPGDPEETTILVRLVLALVDMIH